MMDTETQNLMDIDELAAEAATLVSDLDQASGRVSETPSIRTIRYYNQHGLLDPPTKFRGRKAFYGQKHVLQIVAIKRLQARGLSLSEIQAMLLGVSEERLKQLAEVEKKESDDFWRRRPADVAAKEQEEVQQPRARAPQPMQQELDFSPISGVRLDENTVLMIENLQREVHADDVDAIRVAAAPLMKLLRARYLVR